MLVYKQLILLPDKRLIFTLGQLQFSHWQMDLKSAITFNNERKMGDLESTSTLGMWEPDCAKKKHNSPKKKKKMQK